jgi:hypothetical protein
MGGHSVLNVRMAEAEGFEPSQSSFNVVMIPENPVNIRFYGLFEFPNDGLISEKCVHFVFNVLPLSRLMNEPQIGACGLVEFETFGQPSGSTLDRDQFRQYCRILNHGG